MIQPRIINANYVNGVNAPFINYEHVETVPANGELTPGAGKDHKTINLKMIKVPGPGYYIATIDGLLLMIQDDSLPGTSNKYIYDVEIGLSSVSAPYDYPVNGHFPASGSGNYQKIFGRLIVPDTIKREKKPFHSSIVIRPGEIRRLDDGTKAYVISPVLRAKLGSYAGSNMRIQIEQYQYTLLGPFNSNFINGDY